jgi:Putative Ig domain
MATDIVFDGTTLPDAYIGVIYRVKVPTHAAASIITASSITAGALPAGLALGSAAGAFDEITGTPTIAQEPGSFSFTVSLTDTGGAVTNAMTMNLYAAEELPQRGTEGPAAEAGLSEQVIAESMWPTVQ